MDLPRSLSFMLLLRRAKYCLHFYGSGGFSYVPRLPAWSFQRLICGGVLPPPHSPPAAELALIRRVNTFEHWKNHAKALKLAPCEDELKGRDGKNNFNDRST